MQAFSLPGGAGTAPFTTPPADPSGPRSRPRNHSPRYEDNYAIRPDLHHRRTRRVTLGYDTGVISSALLFVCSVFHLSTAGQSLVAGVVLIGAILGAIVAGGLSDRFGRRPVILVTALAFVIGAPLSAASGLQCSNRSPASTR